MTKVFANYLPQYHEIEENNRFWGKGFTDWKAVQNATPLFPGHNQPVIPLNRNYYDLSDYKVIEWQANLAKKYGIDGFCIYHYWFENSKTVLETPAKLLLEHKDIDIQYFFCWDNKSWIRSWSNLGGNEWAPQFENEGTTQDIGVLLKHEYGDESHWAEHFYWLLPYFLDDRYYRIDGKPVFIIYSVDDKKTLEKMSEIWNSLAEKNGIPGLYLITGIGPFRIKKCLDAKYKYEPMGVWDKKRAIRHRIGKYLKICGISEFLNVVDYKKAWEIVLSQTKRYLKKKIYMCCFVKYDDSPRRGNKSNIIVGATPELFENYFRFFYKLNVRANMDFLLITAWNEWGEGAYLEPDDKDAYRYLEAIKNVVTKTAK